MENVVERSDYPLEKIQTMFKGETFSMLGYGTQGRGQALNIRDSGLNIVVGLREGGNSWKKALEDGWVPGETLFSVTDAVKKADTIMYLLSDAGQKQAWSSIKPLLKAGQTLFFFSWIQHRIQRSN